MAKPWSVELYTLRNVLTHGKKIVQKHQGKKSLLQKGHFFLSFQTESELSK